MNEPKKKRKIFLLGAGAAMSWGGPSTKDVTDLILGKSEHDIYRNTDPVLINLIYNFLKNEFSKDPSYVDGSINFEDIISAVEELILYYYDPEGSRGGRILPHFFDVKPDFEKDLKACFSNNKGVYENLLESLNSNLRSIRLFVHKYSQHYSHADSKILPCDQHFELCRRNERTYLDGCGRNIKGFRLSDLQKIEAFKLKTEALDCLLN